MPGLTEMPSLQQLMADQRQQQMWANIGAMGRGLTATSARGGSFGQGLTAGLANMRPYDTSGALGTYAAYRQIEDSERRREQEAKEIESAERQQSARSSLMGGFDPTSGIAWNSGRQNTGETSAAMPGEIAPPELAEQAGLMQQARIPGLMADAFPRQMDEQFMAQAFPGKPRILEDAEGYRRYVDSGERVFPGVEKPSDPQYGSPQFDESVGKWYQTHPKTLKREYASSPTGFEVTTPDGTVIRTGVPTGGGMQKKTSGELEDKLLNTADALARISNVASSFKPEYQTLGTRGEEWFANLKEKTGLGDVSPEERALVEDYTIYQSTGLDNINRTIKDMTGAQMSAAEAKRIRAAAPDPGEGVWPKQGPTKFIGQVKRVNRDLRAAQARYAYALRNGLSTDPNVLEKQIPLDQMEAIIQQRAEEIEASLPPGTDPSEAMGIIAARVAREFGLPFGGQ